MKPSEEYKLAIKEGRINDAFAIAMGNAPQLKITTWIAESQTSQTSEEQSLPKSGDRLQTKVDLIAGEIVNEIGENAIQDDLYGSLQQFHLNQVNNSHQTVSENLQSLQQMFRLLTLLQKQQLGEPLSAINPWHLQESEFPAALETQPGQFNNSFLPPESLSLEDLTPDEDDEMLDNLLTLDELEIDPEPEPLSKPESTADDEDDWGDLLDEPEEDGQEKSGLKMLDLKNLDLREDEQWENEG